MTYSNPLASFRSIHHIFTANTSQINLSHSLTLFLVIPGLIHAVGLGMIRSISPGQSASLPLGISSLSNSTIVEHNTTITSTPLQAKIEEPISPPSVSLEVWLKIFAIGSNILLQLSPMRLVTEIQVRRSTGSTSPFPLIALTACGFQWSFYGYFAWSVMDNPGFLMLVYANILGFVLGIFYLQTFANFTPSSSLWKNQIIGWSIFLAIEVVMCHLINVSTALLISGGISAMLSVFVSASPLVSVPELIKANDISSMPIDMVFASFISSVLWLWCGYLLQDPWVWIPNMTGVFFGIVQIALLTYVKRKLKSA